MGDRGACLSFVGANVGDVGAHESYVGAHVGDMRAGVGDIGAGVGDVGVHVSYVLAHVGDIGLCECALERVVLFCTTSGCCEVFSSPYHMPTTVIIMLCHEPEDSVARKPCSKTSEDVSWNVSSQMFDTVMKKCSVCTFRFDNSHSKGKDIFFFPFFFF